MNKKIVKFIRDIYSTDDFIALHEPLFQGNEQEYVADAIKSTYVSSVGKYVDQFENSIAAYTKSIAAIAVVNGSSALYTALFMAGVRAGDLVITQSLTFVATCNSIAQLGAEPLFIDISEETLGLCPESLDNYLNDFSEFDVDGNCIHRLSRQRIKVALPMHTFGHPVELDELNSVCDKYNIVLIEDAAESLGSTYKGRHTGTFGDYGILSFNGNKIITTGGGGIILCSDEAKGIKAKHLTTTAKVPHPYEFKHDQLGFNFRLPNINAALGCAQIEKLPLFLKLKRELALQYEEFFAGSEYQFVKEPVDAQSNYWLNAVLCPDEKSKIHLLEYSNKSGVMTRPAWSLMHTLPMFKDSLKGELPVSEWAVSRLVNLPSSVVEVL